MACLVCFEKARSAAELHRRAMAGIIPKNFDAAIQRSIDHSVDIFWNGIRAPK